MTFRQALAWGILTLLVLFVVFNLTRTQVWFFGIGVTMPIGLIVILSAGLGAGATALFIKLRKQPSR